MTVLLKKSAARVLIVEDHPLYRERLSELINKEDDLEVCAEADNIQDALQCVRRSPAPDIVVLDITLNGANGLELLKQMRAEENATPVLVLSMHDDSLYSERSLRAGGQGYVNKMEAAAGIMRCIRRVLAGEICLSQEMTAKILGAIASTRRPLGGMSQLTDRELEIFELIGRGRTTREIGVRLNLGTTTIETYRARLKTKLNLENGTQLAHEAVRWVQSLHQSTEPLRAL